MTLSNAGTGSTNIQLYYFLVGSARYRRQEDLLLCHVVGVKQQREAAPIRYFPSLSGHFFIRIGIRSIDITIT